MKNLLLCLFGLHRWERLRPAMPPRRKCARCPRRERWIAGVWHPEPDAPPGGGGGNRLAEPIPDGGA